MKYGELERNGWKVSEVSFGAWAIGGAWGPRDLLKDKTVGHNSGNHM